MYTLKRYRDAATGKWITASKGKANPSTSTLETIEVEDGLPGVLKAMVDEMAMVPESDLAEFAWEIVGKLSEYRAELLSKETCEGGF